MILSYNWNVGKLEGFGEMDANRFKRYNVHDKGRLSVSVSARYRADNILLADNNNIIT